MNDADLRAVQNLVDKELGRAELWTPWPGGWPDEIATALIDAVFSARATYKTSKGKGVLPKVKKWRTEHIEKECDSLHALSAAIGSTPEDARRWAESFGSLAHAPSRRNRRPDNPLKSAAVREAAEALMAAKIFRANDITATLKPAVRKAMQSVPGIGKATTDYFLILLGHPGVKADVMIHRFITRATGHSVSQGRAVALVSDVAEKMSQSPTALDHAIWAMESRLAKASD